MHHQFCRQGIFSFKTEHETEGETEDATEHATDEKTDRVFRPNFGAKYTLTFRVSFIFPF